MHPIPRYENLNLPDEIKHMIDQILDVSKNLTTNELIDISMCGPWKIVVDNLNLECDDSKLISKKESHLYYSRYISILQLMTDSIKKREKTRTKKRHPNTN